jgi:hypothetical protein
LQVVEGSLKGPAVGALDWLHAGINTPQGDVGLCG